MSKAKKNKKKKKHEIQIPRELRGEIEPWDRTKKKEILHALEVSNGSATFAARLLGVGKTTIYRLRERYQQ